MLWLWLVLFGCAIGVVSGLLGIGGGILLIPGLMYLFGFSQTEAQGTSLAVLIPPIGIFAALVYYEHGFIRLPVVGYIALGFAAGAFLGAKLLPLVPLSVLRPAFGVLLLYVGFSFVFNPSGNQVGAALPAGVVALFSAIVARILGRSSKPKKPLPPPRNDHEYHI